VDARTSPKKKGRAVFPKTGNQTILVPCLVSVQDSGVGGDGPMLAGRPGLLCGGAIEGFDVSFLWPQGVTLLLTRFGFGW
jgi:hypothetical protein